MVKKKELIVYRHAKSDWAVSYGTDFERPLNDRGIKNAQTMGVLLADSNQVPELIISSSSVRTKQTISISQSHGSWDTVIQFEDDLYTGSEITLLSYVQNIDNDIESCMLVSHQPKCSSLVKLLIGGGNIRFPAAGMAKVVFEVNSWKDIKVGSGELKWLLQPSFFAKY